MHVIVGSQAANHYGVLSRHYSTDLDVWVSDEKEKTGIADYVVMPPSVFDAMEASSTQTGIASLNDLYTIKLSHLPYPIKWQKHKRDVLSLKRLGCQINQPLFEVLQKQWSVHHTKEKLNLYQSKRDFFDDAVVKKYEHDYLHELVAQDNVPIYTKCLKDGEEVAIDKDKFERLSGQEQVAMFKEEMMVIALERWLIPWGSKVDIPTAWLYSLEKTTTSLTKGWASNFICANMEEYQQCPTALLLSVLNKLGENIMHTMTLEEFQDTILKPYLPHGGSDYLVECVLRNDRFFEGIEHIEHDGGDEGGAESCFTVLKIDGVYYKVSYAYYSHHGFVLDGADVRVVKPVERTVIAWEAE